MKKGVGLHGEEMDFGHAGCFQSNRRVVHGGVAGGHRDGGDLVWWIVVVGGWKCGKERAWIPS